MITMIQSDSITRSVRNSRRLNDSNIAEDSQNTKNKNQRSGKVLQRGDIGKNGA